MLCQVRQPEPFTIINSIVLALNMTTLLFEHEDMKLTVGGGSWVGGYVIPSNQIEGPSIPAPCRGVGGSELQAELGP